jgi:hypothetical protein
VAGVTENLIDTARNSIDFNVHKNLIASLFPALHFKYFCVQYNSLDHRYRSIFNS